MLSSSPPNPNASSCCHRLCLYASMRVLIVVVTMHRAVSYASVISACFCSARECLSHSSTRPLIPMFSQSRSSSLPSSGRCEEDHPVSWLCIFYAPHGKASPARTELHLQRVLLSSRPGEQTRVDGHAFASSLGRQDREEEPGGLRLCGEGVNPGGDLGDEAGHHFGRWLRPAVGLFCAVYSFNRSVFVVKAAPVRDVIENSRAPLLRPGRGSSDHATVPRPLEFPQRVTSGRQTTHLPWLSTPRSCQLTPPPPPLPYIDTTHLSLQPDT